MYKIIITSLISIVLTLIAICFIFFNSPTLQIGNRISFKSDIGDFHFVANLTKGMDYKEMERQFSIYSKQNNLPPEAKLFRTTQRNYLKISKWCQYKWSPEWSYPLMR